MSGSDRGAYCLLIRLGQASAATIGRLGRFRFPAGYYVYTGSALRNLAARVARHQRQAKRLRWHIDYLLALPAARILGCFPYVAESRQECEINQAVQRMRGAQVPAPGFGSSDCRSGCPAHLTYFRRRPRLPAKAPAPS
jgi:Uri superfamily endonuclease